MLKVITFKDKSVVSVLLASPNIFAKLVTVFKQISHEFPFVCHWSVVTECFANASVYINNVPQDHLILVHLPVIFRNL